MRATIRKYLGDYEAVINECLTVLRRKILFFLPQGRAICPEEEKGVKEEKIQIGTQHTEARINHVISEIVRVSYNTIYPFIAENHIPYQNTFRDYMEKTTNCKKEKAQDDVRVAESIEQSGCETTQEHNVSKPASVENTFCDRLVNGLPPHKSRVLNRG